MMERCISRQRDGLEDDDLVFHYMSVYIMSTCENIRLLLYVLRAFLPFASNICMDLFNSSELFFLHYFRNW